MTWKWTWKWRILFRSWNVQYELQQCNHLLCRPINTVQNYHLTTKEIAIKCFKVISCTSFQNFINSAYSIDESDVRKELLHTKRKVHAV